MRWIRPPKLFRLARGSFLAIATLVASIANAGDGMRVEVEFFEDGAEAPTNRATVWTSGRRVRIEQVRAAAGADSPTFIYRGDQNLLYSIAHGARSYVRLEPRMLSLLAGQTRVARREVSDGLEGLPQDQQRAFGHLLGVSKIDPRRPEAPLVVTRSGEVDEVAGFACRRVTLSRSNRLLARGCVADWEVVGLTPADVEVFRSLASLVHDAVGSRAPIPVELVPGQPLDLVVQFGGFPLAFERVGDARSASAIRVASVEKVVASDSDFEVPPGYGARTGMAGIASFASLFSARGGTSRAAMPAAPDPAAFEADSDGSKPSSLPSSIRSASSGPSASPSSSSDSSSTTAAPPSPAAAPRHADRPKPSTVRMPPRGRYRYRPIRLFEDAP
jgi:hypothetical protein